MGLTERELSFLDENHSAAMVTLRPDGSPHTVRVGVAVVDGKVWSSGTQGRARTAHLRRDPRATVFVFDKGWRGLALDATVTILEGPEVPEQSVRLFQTMQRGMTSCLDAGKLMWNGSEQTAEEFERIMVEERRLIYQFDVLRAYGMF